MHECTVVISRWPGVSACLSAIARRAKAEPGAEREGVPRPDLQGADADEARRLEDELVAALVARGGRVLLIPHVYYLSSDHPAVDRLRDLKGDLVVAAWLHPRATYWILRATGFDDAQRRVLCYDLAGSGSAEAALRELAGVFGLGNDTSGETAGGLQEVTGDVSPRWYPVLDYDRCVDCRQCLDFCLFGVFTVVEGRVVATSPDNCKPGCPACARVCPHGAIIFPHYVTDPVIAGGPQAASPSARQTSQQDRQAPSGASESGGADDLDDLIDALEQLDD